MSSRDVRFDRHANILFTYGARASLELEAASDASDNVTTRNEDSLDLGCATYIAHVAQLRFRFLLRRLFVIKSVLQILDKLFERVRRLLESQGPFAIVWVRLNDGVEKLHFVLADLKNTSVVPLQELREFSEGPWKSAVT